MIDSRAPRKGLVASIASASLVSRLATREVVVGCYQQRLLAETFKTKTEIIKDGFFYDAVQASGGDLAIKG